MNDYNCAKCEWGTNDKMSYDLHKTMFHPRVPGLEEIMPEVSTPRGGIKYPKPKSDDRSMATGSGERPAVTADEYRAGRAVLDALPAGIYLHCGRCGGWFTNGQIWLDATGQPPHCEGCHG